MATFASTSASSALRLLLFGASGRTGRILIEEALQRGHCVTAFVRNPTKLSGLTAALTNEQQQRFKLAGGSAMNGEEVTKVIRNGFDDGKPFDAVLSTLTSDEKPYTTCSVSTTHVLAAFQKLQEEQKSSAALSSFSSSFSSLSPARYLVVGGMFLDEEFVESRSFFQRLLIKPFLSLFAKDRQKEYSLLRSAQEKNPHWCLLMVAPPFLNNGPVTAKYSTDSRKPGMKFWSVVSRQDVAHYMLRLVEESGEQVKTHTEGIMAPLYNP